MILFWSAWMCVENEAPNGPHPTFFFSATQYVFICVQFFRNKKCSEALENIASVEFTLLHLFLKVPYSFHFLRYSREHANAVATVVYCRKYKWEESNRTLKSVFLGFGSGWPVWLNIFSKVLELRLSLKSAKKLEGNFSFYSWQACSLWVEFSQVTV